VNDAGEADGDARSANRPDRTCGDPRSRVHPERATRPLRTRCRSTPLASRDRCRVRRAHHIDLTGCSKPRQLVAHLDQTMHQCPCQYPGGPGSVTRSPAPPRQSATSPSGRGRALSRLWIRGRGSSRLPVDVRTVRASPDGCIPKSNNTSAPRMRAIPIAVHRQLDGARGTLRPHRIYRRKCSAGTCLRHSPLRSEAPDFFVPDPVKQGSL
jgi:hypothetical protein